MTSRINQVFNDGTNDGTHSQLGIIDIKTTDRISMAATLPLQNLLRNYSRAKLCTSREIEYWFRFVICSTSLSHPVALSRYLIIARRLGVGKGKGLADWRKLSLSLNLRSIFPWARMHGTSETHLSWRSISIQYSISKFLNYSLIYLKKARVLCERKYK